MTGGRVNFSHLEHLTDSVGLFEHAEFAEPRHDHGYCVDDVARALVVTAREPEPDEEVRRLAGIYLRFLIDAQVTDGRFRNRRAVDGSWEDLASVEDCWGRALWGLGTAVARSEVHSSEALAAFDVGVRQRSPWVRSMAFAGLGAAEVLSVLPDHRQARALLRGAALSIGHPRGSGGWWWPEPQLRYANAALPETLLAAGSLLGQPGWVHEGLAMLRWLVATETHDGHLSVTPVGGRLPGDLRPAFDQQPIEIAALADACNRALTLTGDDFWAQTLQLCAGWFAGANDIGVVMADAAEGSGFDGMHQHGRNENRGAESTLAMLSTMQIVVCAPVLQT